MIRFVDSSKVKIIKFRMVFRDKDGNIEFRFRPEPEHSSLLENFVDHRFEFIGEDLFLFQDKNGNDVYEGDIIEHCGYDENHPLRKIEISEELDWFDSGYGWRVHYNLCSVKIGNKYEQKTNE
jgi:hypothetical protein